jgi:MraZ protein
LSVINARGPQVNNEVSETTFRGTFPCTVDQKRRLTVPSRFAKALTPRAKRTVVAVHGLEGCLSFYPLDWWQVFENELLLAETTDPELRRGTRRLLASAEDLVLDGQNRITLLPSLLEYAGIRSQAVLLGQAERMELWSPERWNGYLTEPGTPSYEQAMVGVGPIMKLTSLKVRNIRAGRAETDGQE